MPQPTVQQVHINRPLSMISTAYLQDDMNFVALRVFPLVPHDKKSDMYFKYSKNDFLRSQMRRRGPGEESAGSGYNLATDTFSCEDFALHKDIPDQVRSNEDAPLNSDRDAALWLVEQAKLTLEEEWASTYFVTGVWANEEEGGAGNDFVFWDDAAFGLPIVDIDRGKRTMLATTGHLPNKLTLGYDAFVALKNAPDIREYIKYTSQESVTPQILARLFDIPEVLVCQAVHATNAELSSEVADDPSNYDFIQGKHALLSYSPPQASLLQPSAGYTFMWRGVSYGLGTTVGIQTFRMQHLRSDRAEIEMAWDHKVVAPDMGMFYLNCVS